MHLVKCSFTGENLTPKSLFSISSRYGFFDEEAPASYCKILPPTVNQDMLDLGYSHDRMLFYRGGEVSDEVSLR